MKWLIMPHMVSEHTGKHGFQKRSLNNFQVKVNINYRHNIEENMLVYKSLTFKQ